MLGLLTILSLAAAPQVALLSSAGDTTALRFQPLGDAKLAPAAATFTHGDGSTVLGALVPGQKVVLATAVVGRPRDESFGAALFRLEAGQPARQLIDRVAVSTRPLVLDDGRVFVQRGRPGEVSGSGRVDALTVDEVDPRTGQARTVYQARGYTTFLAGALGRELVVYEVGPGGARLLAVHVDALSVRPVVALDPLAFDFTVDAARGRVVFTLGTPGVERWRVVAVDLATGALSTLAEGPTVALVPAVLPDGRVAFAPGQGLGLFEAKPEGAHVLAPQGPGFERLRAVVGGVAVGLHEVPGGFPALVTLALAQGARWPTAFPAGARLDVAGVTR